MENNIITKHMENKQQTAVEWLINEWPVLKSNIPPRIIEQAKEMEKEQIIETSKNSYIAGYIDNQCKVDESMNFPEEYYNETYKK